MSDQDNTPESNEKASSFAEEAEADQPSLVAEFVDFLKYNKKWWLAPILIVIMLLGLLVVVSGSSAAPFIYTLF